MAVCANVVHYGSYLENVTLKIKFIQEILSGFENNSRVFTQMKGL